MIGPVVGKGDPADSGRKDGGSEGLMDLAAWIDYDRWGKIMWETCLNSPSLPRFVLANSRYGIIADP